jgi:hypothetical protein
MSQRQKYVRTGKERDGPNMVNKTEARGICRMREGWSGGMGILSPCILGKLQ